MGGCEAVRAARLRLQGLSARTGDVEYQLGQAIDVHWLGDVHPIAGCEGPLPILLVRKCRHREGGSAREGEVREREKLSHERVSILSRHRDVAQQHIGRELQNGSEAL